MIGIKVIQKVLPTCMIIWKKPIQHSFEYLLTLVNCRNSLPVVASMLSGIVKIRKMKKSSKITKHVLLQDDKELT